MEEAGLPHSSTYAKLQELFSHVVRCNVVSKFFVGWKHYLKSWNKIYSAVPRSIIISKCDMIWPSPQTLDVTLSESRLINIFGHSFLSESSYNHLINYLHLYLNPFYHSRYIPMPYFKTFLQSGGLSFTIDTVGRNFKTISVTGESVQRAEFSAEKLIRNYFWAYDHWQNYRW